MRLMTITKSLLLATAALALSARAAGPTAVPPAAHWFKLGQLQLAALHDAAFIAPNDGTIMGADVGRDVVAKTLAKYGLPTDSIALSVNALLVRMPGHMVLIDTGLGPKAQGGALASLAKARVAPAAVTDVLITHSHGDHVGGLLDANGAPAFPNATVRMAAEEWAWMQASPDAGTKALVAAIAPQVKTFKRGGQILPGITTIAVEGHTPGHTAYEIKSGGARLLDIGDTAHSAVLSLEHPEWAMGFDSDKAVGRASREATLARLAKSHELVFSPHFPFPGLGHVVTKAKAFAWAPLK